jgi:hypothetical protein
MCIRMSQCLERKGYKIKILSPMGMKDGYHTN